MIDWTLFKWAKGVPGRVLRRRRQRRLARAIERCYDIVDQRDGEVCRFPGCYRPAAARHHLIFRSASKARQADPSNVIDVCVEHHAWVHEKGWVRASGDANHAVTWTLTDLGRQAHVGLPFPMSYPTSHFFPVRSSLDVGDPSRLSESAALGQESRGAVDRPMPRS